MAIYHCSAKIISRSTGRSSVAAAAYRSGEKLHNDYDGMTHDYTKKQGVVYSEIMLCNNAPMEYQNRETLWNEVEKIEKGRRAQLSREIEIALPTELNREEQIKLVQDYARENFVKSGMCADFSIHDKEDGNPHAHIMLTMRSINESGQWESKSKKVYQYDKQGNKIYDPKKRQYKCTKENTTDWNDKSKLEEWRKNWADICNREFENKNLPERIDHQTLEEQGIEREPTVHMGTAAHQMEQRGIETDKGNINREVKSTNMEYKQGLEEIEKEVQQLRQSMTQPQPENREQGESLLHGAVKNPDRNDEQETRKWQVGDGLERVEPVQAKETAFTESPNQPAGDPPAHTPPEPEPIAGKSVEQTAERLNSLKTEYIRMELSITQQQAAASNINQEYRQTQSHIEDLKGRTETIEQYSQKIEQLQDRRSSLGVFSGKEKKEIDSQVKRLEQSKAQALQSLARDYGIQPQSAPDKIKELEQTAAKLQEQRSSLPDINAMREQQKTVGEEYQKEKAAAAQHPETDKIKQLTREQERPTGQSMADRMAAAKAESRLEQASHAPNKTQERGR